MKNKMTYDEERGLYVDSNSGRIMIAEDLNMHKNNYVEGFAMIKSSVVEIKHGMGDSSLMTDDSASMIVPEIILLVEGISRNYRRYSAESMTDSTKN